MRQYTVNVYLLQLANVSNFIKKLVVQGVYMTIKLDNERLQELAFVL